MAYHASDPSVDLSRVSAARVCAVTWPFLFVAALYALSPISIQVYPPFSMAPATFRILVIVPRDASNRNLCYSYGTNDVIDRRSCLSMDGENAKRAYTTYWNIRTPGEYTATAVLTRMENGKEKVYSDRAPLRVIGPE